MHDSRNPFLKSRFIDYEKDGSSVTTHLKNKNFHCIITEFD